MQHHMTLILGNPVYKRAVIIIVRNLFARNIAVKDDLLRLRYIPICYFKYTAALVSFPNVFVILSYVFT